jgi:hypothetical protein
MKIPLLGRVIDERFLNYRLRSTSYAGMAGGAVALVIFEYRDFAWHRISWDLLGVIAAMAVVKLSLMAWYLLRD